MKHVEKRISPSLSGLWLQLSERRTQEQYENRLISQVTSEFYIRSGHRRLP